MDPPPSPQANLSAPVGKLVSRLCVLLFSEQPQAYQLFVEGATLTSIKTAEVGVVVGVACTSGSCIGWEVCKAADVFNPFDPARGTGRVSAGGLGGEDRTEGKLRPRAHLTTLPVRRTAWSVQGLIPMSESHHGVSFPC